MRISRKAERRKEKKAKKQKQLEDNLAAEKVKFNVLNLLKESDLDTKPKVAEFLKAYVKSITVHTSQKLQLYPTFKYDISKVFIKFLDKHELIWFKDRLQQQIAYYNGLDEIAVKEADQKTIVDFFSVLSKFDFIK